MPKITVDGKEMEFTPGEMVIQVADRNGIEIPRFCYHPGLTVVAQCRMCAIEVEKMPKLQTACSTPATDGMVIQTKSTKVKQMQSSVMEFLLLNHPLDCPICDKAGECDLQDNSFKFGDADVAHDEQRRTYVDLDMGPVIKKNMNRCIHCTRCIRFCDEVGGYREMIAMKRGNWTEITTQDGKPLETDYAGNLADICPTGSLTLKDFRFKKRAWYLKKTNSVCEGCSRGCNITVEHENNEVFRLRPRENMEINKWWLCDEGRFNFHHVHSPSRVITPMIKGADSQDWDDAIASAKSAISGKVLVLAGSDLTNEELQAIQKYSAKAFKDHALFHFGTAGITKSSDDKDEDQILRRTNKTANLHGAEKLGIKGWTGEGSYDSAIVFRGGRATDFLNVKKAVKGQVVGVGVFNKETVKDYAAVLPGLSYVEKSGTVTNFQGKDQKFGKALEPIGESKSLTEILGELNG